MRTRAPQRLRKILQRSFAAVFGLALAGFIFAWSGLYNVAASRGHWAVVEWLLRFGMRNSVALRASPITPPQLTNPDLVRLGAAHFENGCAFCHGSPDRRINPITDQMLPAPPILSTSMRPWKDEQLFWIVRHGIKYTGMPAWVALEREDEIWAVVAFLKQLPKLDAERYRALAFGTVGVVGRSVAKSATERSNGPIALVCARCHGDKDSGPTSGLVPNLHGQPATFLAAALRSYASGQRRSGIMQPLATDLDEQEILVLADYYARLAPLEKPSSAVDSALLNRGRLIATVGAPATGVPACNVCHGRDALETYPRLDGQNASYMAGQLRLWKAGHNAVADGAAIMAPIARRLSDHDIEAAAAYYAVLPAKATKAASP